MSSADDATPGGATADPTGQRADAADGASVATAEAAETAEPPAEEAAPEPVLDEDDQQVLEVLRGALGDDVLAHDVIGTQLVVRVAAGSWHRAVQTCRELLECDFFDFLSGIDWLPNPDLAARTFWDPEARAAEAGGAREQEGRAADSDVASGSFDWGAAGGATRFQVFCRLASIRRGWSVVLKADLAGDAPTVQSITDLYRGADWHEREAWEMYGFDFTGHPSLRHLYLPGGFEGHPLRKDFPLLAREVKPWPGLVDKEPMPGEDDGGDADGDGGGEA